MKLFLVTMLLMSVTAFAESESCSFKVHIEEGEHEFKISGTVTAAQTTTQAYDMKVEWLDPKPDVVQLGAGTFSELKGEDYKSAMGQCELVEQQTNTKFCKLVKKITLIRTPDVGGDSNDSFILHYRNANELVIGRLVKVGWFIGACLGL
jgi:hypothetical protein